MRLLRVQGSSSFVRKTICTKIDVQVKSLEKLLVKFCLMGNTAIDCFLLSTCCKIVLSLDNNLKVSKYESNLSSQVTPLD